MERESGPRTDEQGRPTRFLGKRKIGKVGPATGHGVPPPAGVLALVPWAADSNPEDREGA